MKVYRKRRTTTVRVNQHCISTLVTSGLLILVSTLKMCYKQDFTKVTRLLMPFKHFCRYHLPRQPALTRCVRKSNSGLHKFTLAMELVIFKHYKSVPVVVLAHSKWMTFESVIHIDSKAARLWITNPNIARIASCARLLLVIDCLTHCEVQGSLLLILRGGYLL